MKFILYGFPIPPTVNKCYPSNKQGRRFKSKDLSQFCNVADIWSLRQKKALKDIYQHFNKLIHNNYWIEVNMYIHVNYNKIYTKKGKLKKIDASNRIKPAHDKLSELIDIDDKYFSVGKSEFILSDKEQIVFILKSSKIKSELDLSYEIQN